MADKFEISTPVAVIIAGVIIAGAIVYTNAHPSQQVAAAGQNAPAATAHVVAPSAQDHIIGSPTAPVVLVEYSDFQCPFCSMVYPTLKTIVDNSGGQVAWVMRNYPLKEIHPQANGAANAAECIAAQLGNKGWWEYADAVFTNQAALTPGYSRQLAQQFGADMTKYDSCVASSTYQDKIDAERADAENSGGNGTPFTVVWGKGGQVQVPVSGAVPQAQFESVINSLK